MHNMPERSKSVRPLFVEMAVREKKKRRISLKWLNDHQEVVKLTVDKSQIEIVLASPPTISVRLSGNNLQERM